VVEDLADLLRTGPGDVAVAAGRALGGIGASALPALVAALAEPGPWRATIAADALVGCGPENLTPLLAALGTRDEQTGELLVAVVAALGDTAVAPLVEYTRTGEPWVRRRATRALAAMAQPANRHVLTTLLTDPDPTVRQAAAAGLSALGRTGLTVLLRALGHENTGIREVVHEALIAAGSPVVDDLLTIAAGRGVPDRTYAVDILTRIGTPEALFGLARIGIGDPIG
jgi:HEAT repeat protein